MGSFGWTDADVSALVRRAGSGPMPSAQTEATGTERELQVAVCDYLRALGTRLRCLWWHTPNGGRRSTVEAAIFQRMGVRAGIPDLAFGTGRGLWFVELKKPGGKLSQAQRDLIREASVYGIPVEVCSSVDEVAEALRAWGLVEVAP